jgi:hypothetical protein
MNWDGVAKPTLVLLRGPTPNWLTIFTVDDPDFKLLFQMFNVRFVACALATLQPCSQLMGEEWGLCNGQNVRIPLLTSGGQNFWDPIMG